MRLSAWLAWLLFVSGWARQPPWCLWSKSNPLVFRVQLLVASGSFEIPAEGIVQQESQRRLRRLQQLQPAPESDYQVDWGDGSGGGPCSNPCRHLYAQAGQYRIKVDGLLRGWAMTPSWHRRNGNTSQLLRIDRWGGLRLATEGGYHFYRAQSLASLPSLTELANAELVRNWSYSFAEQAKLRLQGLRVRDAEDLTGMLAWSPGLELDVSSWDTARVRSLALTFAGTGASVIPGLSDLNTSSLLNASGAFRDANVLLGPAVLDWDVGRLQDASYLFAGARSFCADLSAWRPLRLMNLNSMFEQAERFTSEIGSWPLPANASVQNTFCGATGFVGNLSTWSYLEAFSEEQTCQCLRAGGPKFQAAALPDKCRRRDETVSSSASPNPSTSTSVTLTPRPSPSATATSSSSTSASQSQSTSASNTGSPLPSATTTSTPSVTPSTAPLLSMATPFHLYRVSDNFCAEPLAEAVFDAGLGVQLQLSPEACARDPPFVFSSGRLLYVSNASWALTNEWSAGWNNTWAAATWTWRFAVQLRLSSEVPTVSQLWTWDASTGRLQSQHAHASYPGGGFLNTDDNRLSVYGVAVAASAGAVGLGAGFAFNYTLLQLNDNGTVCLNVRDGVAISDYPYRPVGLAGGSCTQSINNMLSYSGYAGSTLRFAYVGDGGWCLQNPYPAGCGTCGEAHVASLLVRCNSVSYKPSHLKWRVSSMTAWVVAANGPTGSWYASYVNASGHYVYWTSSGYASKVSVFADNDTPQPPRTGFHLYRLSDGYCAEPVPGASFVAGAKIRLQLSPEACLQPPLFVSFNRQYILYKANTKWGLVGPLSTLYYWINTWAAPGPTDSYRYAVHLRLLAEVTTRSTTQWKILPNNCADKTLANGNPWHDLENTEQDCAFYSQNVYCDEGDAYPPNEGLTPNMACCACGGGNLNSSFVPDRWRIKGLSYGGFVNTQDNQLSMYMGTYYPIVEYAADVAWLGLGSPTTATATATPTLTLVQLGTTTTKGNSECLTATAGALSTSTTCTAHANNVFAYSGGRLRLAFVADGSYCLANDYAPCPNNNCSLLELNSYVASCYSTAVRPEALRWQVENATQLLHLWSGRRAYVSTTANSLVVSRSGTSNLVITNVTHVGFWPFHLYNLRNGYCVGVSLTCTFTVGGSVGLVLNPEMCWRDPPFVFIGGRILYTANMSWALSSTGSPSWINAWQTPASTRYGAVLREVTAFGDTTQLWTYDPANQLIRSSNTAVASGGYLNTEENQLSVHTSVIANGVGSKNQLLDRWKPLNARVYQLTASGLCLTAATNATMSAGSCSPPQGGNVIASPSSVTGQHGLQRFPWLGDGNYCIYNSYIPGVTTGDLASNLRTCELTGSDPLFHSWDFSDLNQVRHGKSLKMSSYDTVNQHRVLASGGTVTIIQV